MSQIELTKETLPHAVAKLFEANNYSVDKHVHIHGAEVDLIARSKSDPFAPTIYIEATVEYVNITKYGKDLTKFTLVRAVDSSCVCICLSSNGFTADVKERASISNIKTMTYAELFRSFEKFAPYADFVLNDTAIRGLDALYQEPFFGDVHGQNKATEWLMNWASTDVGVASWIIVLGEYGTGKTALMRVLQRRLLNRYTESPTERIPLRIELRDFTRQFDARSLLHHFLDTNGLSHIPIDFLLQLIRSGRVILLLDGYDEMAQFLNMRERRACLSALADLASGGAKGILTSRPNYFSEAEELHVFEALYKILDEKKYFLGRDDRSYLESEKQIDAIIDRYILERYERVLQDLTPDQTTSLIKRKLGDDPEGQKLIVSILNSVFRVDAAGEKKALSGKPVIITYLLDLVSEIKDGRSADSKIPNLEWTEWSVYKLIIDRLMLRDQVRTPGVSPSARRECLRLLAVRLSQRDCHVADETTFYEILDREFRVELRGLDSSQQSSRRQELFENIRSSATLTRSSDKANPGWTFSHNSLREFLSTELYVNSVIAGKFLDITSPITEPMKAFVASMGPVELAQCVERLASIWPERALKKYLGKYLTLCWDGLPSVTAPGKSRDILPSLQRIGGGAVALDSIVLKNVALNALLTIETTIKLNCSESDLSEVTFSDLDLSRSDFSESILDSVSFSNCSLAGATFDRAFIYECSFQNVDLMAASFKNLTEAPTIFVREGEIVTSYQGLYAIGYLKFHGSEVDAIDDYYVYFHHPKFKIVEKIIEKLAEQALRDIRGLSQRGAAQNDPPLARAFIDLLIAKGLVDLVRGEAVRTTPAGRQAFADFQREKLPELISEFFSQL